MAAKPSYRLGTGQRQASAYKPVHRPVTLRDEWPRTGTALVASLHDPRYYQGILDNTDNFSTESRLEVFEYSTTTGSRLATLDGPQTTTYLDNLGQSAPPPELRVL